jgi:geranylgeranyl pyrophosphate synthase
MRRGKPTLHVYGDGLAIRGDGCSPRFAAGATRRWAARHRRAEAGGHMLSAGAPRAWRRQAIDLTPSPHRGPDALTPPEGMHARKTGALIRAAAVAGAIMAGAPPARVGAVDRYASALGLAFQVVDDVLDVEGEGQALGKTTGAPRRKPTPRLSG